MADAVKELVIRIKREVDPAGVAASKAAHNAERKDIADTASAAKKSARDRVASTKQMIAESKRLERELFAEGRKLAADKAAQEKKYTRDAIQAARQAAAERKRQLLDQKRATDEAAAATRQMTRTLLGTQVAGAALNLVKTGIDAIAQSASDAKDRIRAMTTEAAAARFADREVAALTGNKATVKFSAAQAGLAAQAGVSPEEFRRTQTAFQAQAGQFIGTGPDSKLTGADANDLLQKVASFSASQGIDSADPARLMGAIISKGGKGETNQSRLTTFAKLFKALQLAPGETSPLVGQLTELIQEEVGQGGTFGSVLEAVPLIRAMAERNPSEASTYGRSLIRGLREANMSPDKMGELGLTKGMSFMEQVGAVEKSASAVKAAGGDEGEFLSKYFKDIREFGAVRTGLNAGIRGKGFERVKAEMAGVNANTVAADIQAYLGGEEGRTQTAAAQNTQARLERAAGYTALGAARQRAGTSLEGAGGLNQGEGLGAILTFIGQNVWRAGDRKEQETTALVGKELTQRLSGYKEGREWLSNQGIGGALGVGSRSASESMLAEGFQLLEKLRAAAEALRAGGAAIQAAKPPVPPPAPAKAAPFQGRP